MAMGASKFAALLRLTAKHGALGCLLCPSRAIGEKKKGKTPLARADTVIIA